MKVTVLGCGGSGGVPLAGGVVGGTWGACDPNNPKNRRRRVSILVEEQGTQVLVDTSPDLRVQLIDAEITRLDAVIYTHDHADHSHGVDELRYLAYANKGPIDTYMDEKTRESLTRRFDYIFSSSCDKSSLYRPLLNDCLIVGNFEVGPIPVQPFVQQHGPTTSLGFRFRDIAYSTDASSLNETAFEALEGIKVWIVDCLRDEPHPTHSHFEQTLEWIERVKPERAILTHLNHQIDYEDLKSRCPAGVEPGYDGLTIEI
ncbi:MBL fold metallo-hydrolase [Pelagibius sp. Alg239-R121]|uniref:MBL fold metallo-hydrolase n=1 Tax=Pelagibius sp. Alg239-R121 TaxID=2993448 RepID=UPI0024A6CE60|nr:MBL fold metallo-hydrolase [Pelagibius sp. Alg239-R121]